MTKEGDVQNAPVLVSLISTVIINGISCPLIVLLNLLVIMAVKRRPRLQTNTNILLACLAATDAVLTGLLVQPSFIVWATFKLLRKTSQQTTDAAHFHDFFLRIAFMCSSLHLMLVTGERLIAIKFTMRYPSVVTTQKIKYAVMLCWILAITWGITVKLAYYYTDNLLLYLNFALAVILISCVLFITCSYVILYRETLRQRKKMKTQQLRREEVERFAKESKALKTTVYVVGAVVICLLPAAFYILWIVSLPPDLKLMTLTFFYAFTPWISTFGILNSLLNPLIYCWRQKEMRKFVFRFQARHVVLPVNLS